MGIFGGISDLFTGEGNGPDWIKPTAQEKGLQQAQTGILNTTGGELQQQGNADQALMPQIYSRLGYSPTTALQAQPIRDANGKITGWNNFTSVQDWTHPNKTSLNPEEQANQNMLGMSLPAVQAMQRLGTESANAQIGQMGIQQLMQQQLLAQQGVNPNNPGTTNFNTTTINPGFQLSNVNTNTASPEYNDELIKILSDRAKSAANGNFVDPTLQRQFDEQYRNLATTMEKNVGPGWQSSTAGQQALQTLKRNQAEAAFQGNQAIINTAVPTEQLIQSNRQIGQGERQLSQRDIAAAMAQAAQNSQVGANERQQNQGDINLALTQAANNSNITRNAVANTLGASNLVNTNGTNALGGFANFYGNTAAEGGTGNQLNLLTKAADFPYNNIGNLMNLSQAYNAPINYGAQQRAGQLANSQFDTVHNQNNLMWENMGASFGSSFGGMGGGMGTGKGMGKGGMG